MGRQKALQKRAMEELGYQRRFDQDGLEEQRSTTSELIETLPALDAALEKLESLDREAHEVAMMRYFARLTQDEIASILGVHRSEIYRRHKRMKDFLSKLLGDGPNAEIP
jgi:RNA polymerase sigma factor (sigma-70 family)